MDTRETHLNIMADNRETWEAATDDPVMKRKFESIGAKLIKIRGDTNYYQLDADQVLLRKQASQAHNH